MKTLEQILAKGSNTLDGRDFARLVQFMTPEQLKEAGYNPDEEFFKGRVILPFTRKNVLAQLENDVAFGFEKAVEKRGISSGLMFSVVMMWNGVLEEGLEDYDEDNGYAQYGLPLFKATALKYGFPNLIGNDEGDEDKYSSDYEGGD